MSKGTPIADVAYVQTVVGRANYIASYFGDMRAMLISCNRDQITRLMFCSIQVIYLDTYRVEFDFRYQSSEGTKEKLDSMVIDACRKIFEHAANNAIKSDRFNF